MLRERDPARGYISRPPMIPAYLRYRLASDHRRSRAATAPSYRTPPAQKVDILHKKLSLNGALCAKPSKVGAELGAITLYGVWDPDGWRYSTSVARPDAFAAARRHA